METSTAIVLAVVVLVVLGGVYVATRPPELALASDVPMGPTNDAAQIITAAGGAVGGILGGVGGLLGGLSRGASNSAAGAAK